MNTFVCTNTIYSNIVYSNLWICYLIQKISIVWIDANIKNSKFVSTLPWTLLEKYATEIIIRKHFLGEFINHNIHKFIQWKRKLPYLTHVASIIFIGMSIYKLILIKRTNWMTFSNICDACILRHTKTCSKSCAKQCRQNRMVFPENPVCARTLWRNMSHLNRTKIESCRLLIAL